MEKYRHWDDKTITDQIVRVLNEGNVVVGTSDTVVGLVAPLTKEGKSALDLIKQREDKPYLVLVRDTDKAAQFSNAVTSRKLQPLLKACWPGPLTIIVPANANIPDYMKSHTGAIALRVPKHEGLQKVLAEFDGLFSTSANLTGDYLPASIEEIDPQIMDTVSLIVDDTQKGYMLPSTIIDCTGANIKLIREGEYSRDKIAEYVALEI